VFYRNNVVMPWGRYRGQPLRTLPTRFLDWLAWHPLCADLRLAAMIELDRRQGRRARRACPLCGAPVPAGDRPGDFA
jgi:hypothetical protein